MTQPRHPGQRPGPLSQVVPLFPDLPDAPVPRGPDALDEAVVVEAVQVLADLASGYSWFTLFDAVKDQVQSLPEWRRNLERVARDARYRLRMRVVAELLLGTTSHRSKDDAAAADLILTRVLSRANASFFRDDGPTVDGQERFLALPPPL